MSDPTHVPSTDRAEPKPRLLYFNGPWHYVGDRINTSYVAPLRRVLEQDFEVVSVEGNCDFKAEVQRYHPDAVLFHTGTESQLEEEVEISNTDAYREIPRMGYVMRDPISPSRAGPINRLRAWGVDQVFANFSYSDSPIPFFRDVIFVPWSIDERIFRDYGEPKCIPVSLTGEGWLSDRFFYRWRAPLMAQLRQRLPIFHVPVLKNHESGDAYHGEAYARLLNRSMFSAGCGSANHFLTRKMLEIPACRACLITEETEVAKWAGFRDGVNCVFADSTNVLEKVESLLRDPDRLAAITAAGYEFVHAHHSQRNRRAFAEWYRLWKQKGADERIVQRDPLKPLELQLRDAALPISAYPAVNPVVRNIAAGYAALRGRNWKEALAAFQRVLAIIPYIADAKLGAAVALLRLGQPEVALSLLFQNTESLANFRMTRWPDAITLSFMAVALIQLGTAVNAYEIMSRAALLRHPAFNSLRWLLATLKPQLRSQYRGFDGAPNDNSKNVETVHCYPADTFSEWLEVWKELLHPSRAQRACPSLAVA